MMHHICHKLHFVSIAEVFTFSVTGKVDKNGVKVFCEAICYGIPHAAIFKKTMKEYNGAPTITILHSELCPLKKYRISVQAMICSSNLRSLRSQRGCSSSDQMAHHL